MVFREDVEYVLQGLAYFTEHSSSGSVWLILDGLNPLHRGSYIMILQQQAAIVTYLQSNLNILVP